MRLIAVRLRWYKSFNIDFLGTSESRADEQYAPWNSVSLPGEDVVTFPFIDIPIEADVTTFVGANESGKSHLLSAISKVISGLGTDEDAFARNDLCRFASSLDDSTQQWPQIGLEFESTTDEDLKGLAELLPQAQQLKKPGPVRWTIILTGAPDAPKAGLLFVPPDLAPKVLSPDEIRAARALMPPLRFLRSELPLPDEISIQDLLHAYDPKKHRSASGYTPDVLARITSLVDNVNPQQVGAPDIQKLQEELKKVRETIQPTASPRLVLLLFRDVLGIELPALEELSKLTVEQHGHAAHIVAGWNDAIEERLALSHYWQQDDKFRLIIDYRHQMLSFDITDKTGKKYTFKERSSGLRYFLSYYIQAKALDIGHSDRGGVLLMDEPDSFLSTTGQRNFLRILETLVDDNPRLQVIYTTHSPFLINRNYPRRIRLLRKGDAEEGTQFVPRPMTRRYEPIRSALGIDCAQSLFMGSLNLVLEGPTDQMLLSELTRELASRDDSTDFLDLNSVTLVSAESAPNVPRLLAASKWGDEPSPPTVVLLDSDAAGDAARAAILQPKEGRALLDAQFVVQAKECLATVENASSFEDLIPPALYLAAVSAYALRCNPSADPEGISRRWQEARLQGKANVAAAELALDIGGPDGQKKLDKFGIAQEVVDIVKARRDASMEKELRSNLRGLSLLLRDRLDEARRSTHRESARQAIQRLVAEWRKTRARSAAVHDIGYLIGRVSSEAESLGADGKKLKAYLADMEAKLVDLKSRSLHRVEGAEWKRWMPVLEGLRRNPLEPKAVAVSKGAPSEAK